MRQVLFWLCSLLTGVLVAQTVRPAHGLYLLTDKPSLDTSVQRQLKAAGINTVYYRASTVVFDAFYQSPIEPRTSAYWSWWSDVVDDKGMFEMFLVPSFKIDNEVLRQLSEAEIRLLAAKLSHAIKEEAQVNLSAVYDKLHEQVPASEWERDWEAASAKSEAISAAYFEQYLRQYQLDCRWTMDTYAKFSLLLTALEDEDKTYRQYVVVYPEHVRTGKEFSTKIRRMWVPVAGEMLTDADLLTLEIPGEKPSRGSDVALPMWSTLAHYRGGELVGYLPDLHSEGLYAQDFLEKKSETLFVASRNADWAGRFFRPGDEVRVTLPATEDIKKQAAQYAPNGGYFVFYHLNPTNLKSYASFIADLVRRGR